MQPRTIVGRSRRTVRKKMGKMPKIHGLVRSLHLLYCKFTGKLHVLPDFVIIGAAKCGTTSLFDYLVHHPSIYSPVGKELHFFDELYNRGENWYRACFPLFIQKYMREQHVKGSVITGEATPKYLDPPEVPIRMKKLVPDTKIIVMLRNPVDRAFSHYVMNVKNGYENLNFEEAIRKENERTSVEKEKMLSGDTETSKVGNYYLYAYLDRGKYIEKLERWMEIFSKEQFLIIKSEDFFTNPKSVYHHVLDFLGLDHIELESYPRLMSGKYGSSKLNPSTRQYLIDYFRPYNERLYKFLGINYRWEED